MLEILAGDSASRELQDLELNRFEGLKVEGSLYPLRRIATLKANRGVQKNVGLQLDNFLLPFGLC
jgi:hypothetical protein